MSNCTVWTQSFFRALARALLQWRIAWLFAAATLVEARRVNKIALITPFLSVVLQAGCLGLVYAALFNVDLQHYIPYLAVSLAMWHSLTIFLANAIGYNDIANRHLTFTTLSIYTIHLAGLIETGLLLLVKLLAALMVVTVVRQALPTFSDLLMAVFGIILVASFMFFAGVLAAYLFDRFRLLKAILPQLIFLAFLVTPVIWRKDQLQRMAWLADYNPLSHVLDVVRAPLLAEPFPWLSLGIVVAITGVLAFLGIGVHRANRTLVVFRWVA